MNRIKGNYLLHPIALILVLALSLSSCNKFLDIESQHMANEENKWKDINDARASLMGIYGLVRTALAENNAHWLYGDLRDGNFIAPNKRELQDVIDGNLMSSTKLMENLSNWRKFYAAINAANLFIKYSGQIVELDAQYTEINHRIDVAQARALKGFCYFLMARIWGEVPIWDKAYEGSFPTISISSQEVVLAYAENELKPALEILPYRYGTLNDEVYPVERYHGFKSEDWDGVLFNRLSVNAILAHLCAWDSRYLESSIYSDFVLTHAEKSGAVYATTANFTNPEGFFFTSSNSHLVAFPFKWSAMEGSFDGHIEQLTLAAPLVNKPTPDMYIPIEQIMKVFHEKSDVRFHIDDEGNYASNYFSELTGVIPIFSKVKVIRGGSTDGSFPIFSSVMVFSRLEDIALLRAEALAVLGDDLGIAQGILNQIRRSRGLGEMSVNADLIDEIFAERRRELMGEGWSWYDLVRYNKIKRNDLYFTQLIDNKGIYWPIAEEVLTNNRQLKQNPYWENN